MQINRQHAQSIVDEMKCSIHRDINIMDQQGVIIASTNPARSGRLHQGAAELIAGGLPSLTVLEDDPARGVQAGINLPIVIDDELLGVIGITGNPAEVGVFGDVIKRMTELMLESVRQKEDSDLMDRAKGLFIENWLFADRLDWAELEIRGRLLGIDIAQPYTVAILQLSRFAQGGGEAAGELGELQSNQILRMIQSRLRGRKNHDCAVVRNRIIVLLGQSGRQDSYAVVNQICQDVGSYYGVRVGGGISSVAKAPGDIRRCYAEARTAGMVAGQSPRGGVLFYDEVSLEFIVQSIPSPILKDLRDLVFSACDEEEAEALSRTVNLYFDCDGNLNACAQAAYVHRNTVQYRLECVRKRTGYDLRIPKDAILLYLASHRGTDLV